MSPANSTSAVGRWTLTATFCPSSHADVHLPDRRGGHRLGVEPIEHLRGRATQFLEEDPLDVRVGERRDPIEQVEQLVAVLERHDVGLERQHLAELDEAAAEVLEQPAETLGSGKPGECEPADEPGPAAGGAGHDARGAMSDQHARDVEQSAAVGYERRHANPTCPR